MSEVQAMIYGLGFGRPTQQFVVMMHSVTQGNPFCIWEMVHRLHQQGTLEKRGGYVSTTVPLPGLRLPTQMTDAIQSRIQILTPRCQEVLKLASCCGTSFSFPLLSQVTTIDDEGLFDLLDEGIQHHLVLDESETFHFAHPLIRHTLYHMSNTVRRQHWHRRIAESLEALYAQESEAHLLEMTHHWVRAGPTADAAKVMAYARRAGDQACRMFAWGEAAQYYESALALGDTKSGLQPQEQAYLHYQAGLAYHRAGDGGPCLSHYEQARAVYAHLDDIVGLARVLLEQTRLGFTLVSVPYGTLVDLQPLEKTLEALGENAPELRGHIAAVMSEAYRHAKQPERATTMATNALTLAEQLDDDRLGAYANFALGLAQAQELYVDATLDSWEKSLACAQRANDVWLQGWSLQRLPLFFLMQGRLDDAEARAQQASELARQAQDWWGYSVASSALAAVAVNKGDFMAVEQYAQETMTMVARCSYPWGGFRALMALACAQTLRGAWEAAEQALNMILEPGRVFPEAGASIRTFVQTIRHWMWSQTRSVAPALEQLATDLAATGDVDNYSLAPFCAFIEMGARHLAPTLVAPVYLSLQKIAERGVQFAVFGVFSLARILGVAASCMQQWEQAEAHFQVAIENATRAHAKPEVGRTYLDYAHMLSVRNQPHDRHQAAVLASQAELLLRTIGIEPLARQAARLVADLQTPQPETYASAVVSVPLLSPLEVDMLLRSTRWHTNFLT
jgi:tetratricopeptide (TPR) repeat protein